MFNYQWLAVLEDIVLAFSYDLTGFYNYNVLIAVGFVLLSIGAILMLIGTSKVIKTIIRAVLPNPVAKYRILFSRIFALIRAQKSSLSAVARGCQTYCVA